MAQSIPSVGQPAPPFTLPDAEARPLDLNDHLGRRPVVLYFYPKADTPGCTKEACGFRDAIASYSRLDVPVFGISPDPVADVKAFSDKLSLNFPLLADADHAVCERYGVWIEKKTQAGVPYMGAARTTFIIGSDGKIAQVFEKVQPEGHDAQVLEWLTSNLR